MSRKKVPVAILRSSGSRHYSKEELAIRERSEIKTPLVKHLDPPAYLSASLAVKFRKISAALIRIGVLSELDDDSLARYLIAESNYLRVTNRLTAALNSNNLADADKLSSMQDRFFKQCRAAGSDLGLTVSGRCNLTLLSGEKVALGDEEGDLFVD